MAGSTPYPKGSPRWLLAELTYRCPLQCPYCSNPVDYANHTEELSTDEWKRVFSEARAMGAVQLGLSGGEPLIRDDLDELIRHARSLGFYINLISSGYGLTEEKVASLKTAGLDHIQISIQAPEKSLNDFLAGTESFEQKKRVAGFIKSQGYPMVLCVVIHRHNIHLMREIIEMAVALGADYLELANTQYYGWAHLNRDQLLPSKEQFETAEKIAQALKEELKGRMKIYYVVPDYYEDRPKPCMNGWGTTFLTIAPDGLALPCHEARMLPGLDCPSVRDFSVREIWDESPAFGHFRNFDWMQEPCRSCPEKSRDFGGCRCQAYLLTGDMNATDPVCSKSPDRERVGEAIRLAALDHARAEPKPLVFRNSRNSRALKAH